MRKTMTLTFEGKQYQTNAELDDKYFEIVIPQALEKKLKNKIVEVEITNG